MWNSGNSRVSVHINRDPAVNFHHATRVAALQGEPLNWMVSINFSLLSVKPQDASGLLQKLIGQRFAPWLRRTASNDNQIRPTYVWSIEAPNGSLNGHWLVHLPKRLSASFGARLESWAEGLTGLPPQPHAIHIQPIYNLIGARRYALKGINPVWAKHLGIAHVPQGLVIGKRSGFSRNLGPTARKRSGYKPRRHQY